MRQSLITKLPPYWFDTLIKLILVAGFAWLIVTYAIEVSPKVINFVNQTESATPIKPIHELDKLSVSDRVLKSTITREKMNELFQQSLTELKTVRMHYSKITDIKPDRSKFFNPVNKDASVTHVDLRMQISYPELIKFIEFWQKSTHTILWQKVDYYETHSRKHEAALSFLIV